MPLPSSNANGQSSIRNFFRPKQPTYAPPPSATQPSQPPPPSTRGQYVSPPPMTASNANGNAAYSATPPSKPTPRHPSIHPQAAISPIEPEHIPALRRITSLILPVNYPDSFWASLANPLSSGAFSRVLLWSEPDNPGPAKVIGGLVCRPEPSPFQAPANQHKDKPAMITPHTQPNALYIQSLVLLSPYRGLGLAAALLDEVVSAAATSDFACHAVYAHVWTENQDGLRWYLARGFAQKEELKGYYFKLRPDSAWIVLRDIGPGGDRGVSAALGLEGNGSAAPTHDNPSRVASSVTALAANLSPSTSKKPSPVPTPPLLATTASALAPPPRASPTTSTRPSPSPTSASASRGTSYQNTRPETEWNDLPVDMQPLSPTPPQGKGGSGLAVPGSGDGSAASSRSSSAVRKKRDRAYPAAAFGK